MKASDRLESELSDWSAGGVYETVSQELKFK